MKPGLLCKQLYNKCVETFTKCSPGPLLHSALRKIFKSHYCLFKQGKRKIWCREVVSEIRFKVKTRVGVGKLLVKPDLR